MQPSSKGTHQLNKQIIRYETPPLTRYGLTQPSRRVSPASEHRHSSFRGVCVGLYHGASAAFELSNQSEMNYARVSYLP